MTAQQIKNEFYLSFINGEYFSLTDTYTKERFNQLEKVLCDKFKISKDDSKEAIKEWIKQHAIIWQWINHYEAFKKYSENYCNAVIKSGKEYTIESLGKLRDFIDQTNDLYEKSKRMFCLYFACEYLEIKDN
jgi:polyhydroxyalkanoate synthesis regulator phasin